MPFALLLTWGDTHKQEYLCDPATATTAAFATRADALARRREVLEKVGWELSAIDIVPFPRGLPGPADRSSSSS